MRLSLQMAGCWWWLLGLSYCSAKATSIEDEEPNLSGNLRVLASTRAATEDHLDAEYVGNAIRVRKNTTTAVRRGVVEKECGAPTCDLHNTQWGVPTVLLSQGRSGSSALWENLDALYLDRETTHAMKVQEDMKGSPYAIEAYLKKNEKKGKCWLVTILCNYQTKYRNEGRHQAILGTKWKPYMPAFNSTAARAALQWIGEEGNPVKVIFSQRNPLDVQISRTKHGTWINDKTHVRLASDAHCQKGQLQCVRKHQEMAKISEVNLDTLHMDLETTMEINNQALAVLDELKVPYVNVTYEKLFYGETADDWIRMADFLGLQSRNGKTITRKDVERVSTLEATSDHNDRSKNLANYEEVVKTLKGTQHEKYLNY